MAAIDDLPPLREVVLRYGLQPTKALGQNFLFDLNLTARIARAAGVGPDQDVVEIGPGPGGLTRALLATGARRVIAVERDPRCQPALAEIAGRYPGRLVILMGDALEIDIRPHLDGPAQVVANLPYNVATPLIVNWIRTAPWPPWFSSLTLMVQREFADRLSAGPSHPKDYGRISVLTQWRMSAKSLFDVPPQAFFPPPKVVSTVVRLVPLADAVPFQPESLERLTQAAFGQRRKMLRQSLKGVPGAITVAADLGIAGDRRAEEVPPAIWVEMARRLDRSDS
jgi:16S rRNA (adenine1518-N6/adenine1519-N6)-dimethyltransferase